MDNYVVRLSKLALSCKFSDKNEMIRDQVVNSCNSSKLRKKLLEEDNLTLEHVQQISRTYELSETHSRRMEVLAESSSTNGTSNEEVNQMRHVKPSRNKNKGARPKEYPKTTHVNQRARPHDRRQQGEITAICYRCGEGGHYGKNKERHVLRVRRKTSFCENV